MDLKRIGLFIALMRKEKGLTQKELADKLYISDKTVSKWETGNGLCDVTLMEPLCKELGITVNELLSGERIDDTEYKKRAEENMLSLALERKQSKRNILLSIIVGIITLLSAFTILMASGYYEMPTYQRIILIIISIVILIGGIYVVCILDYHSGTFECRHCKKRFIPSMGAYLMGPHTITTRQLKCPHCGKRSYCKKRLTK
ncbi:MAG: helix-turn-helix transcriptional regulator [Clostridia bacterium]|nr:helix-turn-helix transcriptional regulator [Clostridia bacterium]